MSLPAVSREIRAPYDGDDPDDYREDKAKFMSSVGEAWEHLTTLPTIVIVMGKPFTFDSTGMPPWVNTEDPPSALQPQPTAQEQVETTQAAAQTKSPSDIELTHPTRVSSASFPRETESQGLGAHAGSSATLTKATATNAPGLEPNTASPTSSTSCEDSLDAWGQFSGAATSSTTDYDGSNGGVTSQSGSSSSAQDQGQGGSSGPRLGLVLAGVIIPVLVISLVAFTVLVVLRRRKQRRDAERALPTDEMKMRLNTDSPSPPPSIVGRDNNNNSREPPPAAGRQPSPPQVPPTVVTSPPPAPPPVIVSAMNPANNASYFTGIDTSEALSVRTNSVRSGQQRPAAGFMLDGEFHEEPPPPYRPRSVPPISRGSSMRISNRSDYASSHHFAGDHHHSRGLINPFADPSDDDDNVSVISGAGAAMDPFSSRRSDDHLSVVSDMSYQHEPAAVHQSV